MVWVLSKRGNNIKNGHFGENEQFRVLEIVKMNMRD